MLAKKNRLQKNRDFQQLFKKTRPINCFHLTFWVGENKAKEQPIRFGFVVSNKIDKRATVRNALKRQLREIAMSLICELENGYDVVVTVKKNFALPYNQDDIKKEFLEGLKKAHILK